jgi:prepilin signal peptidase PulO-like enzyme (type II secretory pathway)
LGQRSPPIGKPSQEPPAVLPASPSLAILVYLLTALAGLAAGVGVNALADQIAGDEDPPLRGDQCPTCRATLPTRRLVPLAGWFLLGRRCPACGAALAPRRLLVDLALMVAFPFLLAHIAAQPQPIRLPPLLLFGVDALAATVLALIFVIDLEHHLILDIIVYPAALALVGVALALDRKALAAIAVGAVLSGGLFLLFYGLGFLLYHEEALGFGDVKLAALIGMMVGWPGIIGALILCALLGAAVSVLLLGLGRVSTRTYIPFGTFLSLGAACALLLTAPLW